MQRIAAQTIIFVIVAAMSSAAQTAPAPEQPDAMDLLKSVELAYGAINTYSAKLTSTTAMNGSDAKSKANMEQSVTITADSTGKFRRESTDVMGMVMIYDGNTLWMYMPAANAYSKLASNGASPSAEARASGMSGGANPLQEYKNVTRGVKDAKVLRSEKVDVNGSDVDCWVVSLEYEPLRSEAGASMQAAGFALSDFARSETLWVDKNRYLVYRKDSTTKMTMPNTNTPINMTQTSKVETFAVNGPLSPDVFTFTPPPGARDG